MTIICIAMPIYSISTEQVEYEETFYDGQKVSVSKMVRAMFEKRLALLKTQEKRNKKQNDE